MKYLLLTIIPFFTLNVLAQKNTALVHGTVYGTRPNTSAWVKAQNLEATMGNKTRINTTVRGWVTKVTNEKNGWFEMDAGKGKIIKAHFKNYGIHIPASLKGKIVIVEGVAQKQFMADDLQHYAGDTVSGKKQHSVKVNPLRRMTLEVTGLMVEQ